MLTVITGRCGSGKTRRLLSLAASRAKGHERVLLLLPEPNTYDGELALMDALGGPLFNCEALGMDRLARRVLDSAGGGARLFLSAEGRRMALRRIIDEKKDELALFSGVSARSGFTERAGELIDLFKNADILPFDLKNAARELGDGLLSGKLQDLSVLYSGLLDFMAGKYMDRADSLRLLCEKMEGSEYLRGLHVFFDSPHGFLYDKRTFAILGGLIRNCASVTMTLRLSDPGDNDREIFAFEERVLAKLSELSAFDRLHLRRGENSAIPAGLRALERRLFAPGNRPEPDCSGVFVCAAATPFEEREAVCDRVISLLKNGAKPGEIYIVTASESAAAPLRADMARLGLPLFMDERRPLSHHPLVEFILSSLSACLHNFRREDVLRVAKNAFSPVSSDQAEALEDYSARFGVSFGSFLQPFERGAKERPRLAAAAERARAALVPQLLSLAESLKACGTSADCCRALYDYLIAAGIREKLAETGEKLTALGRAEAESVNAQAYDAVIDLLDQIAELMGGEMSPKRFLLVLDEGFAARTIGLLPPAADAISCGDAQTASGREMRHLIVLGATDGTLPKAVKDDGMIDDGDIGLLQSVGIDAFYSLGGRAVHERHITYALLSRPAESLFLSYSETDESGAPASRSEAADRLAALFPNCFCRYSPKPAVECTDPEQGFAALLRGLRGFLDSGAAEDGLDRVYAHYAKAPKYQERLRSAVTRMFGASGMAPEDAKALYGSWKGSTVTRLEAFNRCPFAYLVDYGLRPDARKEFDEDFSDEGSYLHDAFYRFFQTIRQSGPPFAELSDEQALSLLDTVLNELEKTHNNGWLFATPENMHTAALLRRAAQRSVLAMLAQLRSGRFFPVLEEAELGKDLPAIKVRMPDGSFAELAGRIDRLDEYRGKNAVYVRVIDYKTGDKTFSKDELEAGIQLQLPLYLRAAAAIGLPAGMFYLRVGDPVLDAAEENDGLKRYKLRGVLLCDGEVARAMDNRSAGWSDIVPVQFTKDGLSEKSGALLSAEEMEDTLKTAEDVAAATIARILSGECGAKPYAAKGGLACDFCGYSSICRFEPRRRGRKNS